MADDNSTAPPAPGVSLDPCGELITALLDIKGTVMLSRQGVYGTMSLCSLQADPETSAETLQAVDGALGLTEAAIERLCERLESMRNRWSTSIAEVAHG